MSNTKGYPKTADHPTFEVKAEEDWVDFGDIIDTLQNSYDLPDAEITSRLPNILIGVARVWYRVTCKNYKGASWEIWRGLIERKYNTSAWRIKQLALLERERFTYSCKDILEFLLKLLRRIQAVYPESRVEDQISHVLMRLPTELHATIRNSSRGVTDISEFLSICEDILESSWGRKNATAKPSYASYGKFRSEDTPIAVKKPSFHEKNKALTVPLHGSSRDGKPQDKKLCYRCKNPWATGHKCNGGGLINMIEEQESSEEEIPNSDIDDLNNNSQEEK